MDKGKTTEKGTTTTTTTTIGHNTGDAAKRRSASLSEFVVRCIVGYALMASVTLAVILCVVATGESTFFQVTRHLCTANYYMLAHLFLCYAALPFAVAGWMGEDGILLCQEIVRGKRRSKAE